jgi:hypothetical protein
VRWRAFLQPQVDFSAFTHASRERPGNRHPFDEYFRAADQIGARAIFRVSISEKWDER